MKALASVLFAAALALGPTSAKAFCIDFPSFCDDFDLDFDASAQAFFGTWDLFCGGDFPQLVSGTRATVSVGIESLLGLAGHYDFDFNSRTFRNVFFDGVAPFVFLSGEPFNITPVCDGPVGPVADLPSSAGR